MRNGIRRASAIVLIASFALSGCVTTTFRTKPNLTRDTADLRVLLMPVDIELSELSAGGVTEPNAEWTAKAEKHVLASIEKTLRKNKTTLVNYVATADGRDPMHPHVQLVKLHEAVGQTILTHKYRPALRLPNKVDVFDWTLGPGVGALGNEFDTDYAMFVFIRDSYTSAGRAVVMVLTAALGVAIPGGQQVGFASLVDLRTGELVWFNVLARGHGDLRSPEAADETVSALLQDLPK